MADAFIYDHVRTPRGRGKADGSLHGTTPIQLAAQVLGAVRDRNELDTALLDDVVLGCVSPLGEQGADIARVAVLVAGYDETVPGQQLNRFCASGLEAVNNAAAQVMSGQAQGVIGGGVESMSRVPMGSDGGAWAADPAVAYNTYFVPQGVGADLIATIDGYSRTDVDSLRGREPASRCGRLGRRPVREIGHAGQGHSRQASCSTATNTCGRTPRCRASSTLKPAFAGIGEQGGFDAIAQMKYPQVETHQPRAHRGQLERHRRRRGGRADRQQALRREGRDQATRARPRLHLDRHASRRSC